MSYPRAYMFVRQWWPSEMSEMLILKDHLPPAERPKNPDHYPLSHAPTPGSPWSRCPKHAFYGPLGTS